jgi:hypothetical protein
MARLLLGGTLATTTAVLVEGSCCACLLLFEPVAVAIVDRETIVLYRPVIAVVVTNVVLVLWVVALNRRASPEVLIALSVLSLAAGAATVITFYL